MSRKSSSVELDWLWWLGGIGLGFVGYQLLKNSGLEAQERKDLPSLDIPPREKTPEEIETEKRIKKGLSVSGINKLIISNHRVANPIYKFESDEIRINSNRYFFYKNEKNLHPGIDIFADTGIPVYSITNGIVDSFTSGGTISDNKGVYYDYGNKKLVDAYGNKYEPGEDIKPGKFDIKGNSITIKTKIGNRDYYLEYMHLKDFPAIFDENDKEVKAKKGESINVFPGYKIGKVGTTGRSSAPHLHLGVYTEGVDSIDPYNEFLMSNVLVFPNTTNEKRKYYIDPVFFINHIANA